MIARKRPDWPLWHVVNPARPMWTCCGKRLDTHYGEYEEYDIVDVSMELRCQGHGCEYAWYDVSTYVDK